MANTSLIGQTVQARVESFGGLGDGIARLNGKPVYIPKSCEGDVLELRITHENHEGCTARIQRVLEPGLQRREAPCPHFDACGGCSLQQLREDAYREFKTRMLHGAIARAGFPPDAAEMVFLPAATRRRVEFKIHHMPAGLRLGFYEPKSRTPVPIETCLILHPRLRALLEVLPQALAALPFAPVLRAAAVTLAASGLDMLLHATSMPADAKSALAALAQKLHINRASVKAGEEMAVAELSPVTMRFGAQTVPLPPEAFLQATAQGEEALVAGVLAGLPQQGRVVDLFSGLGTYSFPLLARQGVHAVELEPVMARSLSRLAKGRKEFTAEARDLFKNPLSPAELSAFAGAVINPPRAGAKAQSQAIAQSRLGRVVMVSCNPASFARDAHILKEGGFSLRHAFGLDQFVWSQHLEILAEFSR